MFGSTSEDIVFGGYCWGVGCGKRVVVVMVVGRCDTRLTLSLSMGEMEEEEKQRKGKWRGGGVALGEERPA